MFTAKVRENGSSLIVDIAVKDLIVKYIFCPDQGGGTNQCVCAHFSAKE